MFYKSFAQPRKTYGLLVYCSAAATNLMKIENAQLRIISAIFFRKKIETLSHILEVNNMYTVFELCIVEVLKELFKELRGESLMHLLQPNELSEQCIKTRSASKGLFSPTYNRSFASRKSLSNSLKKAYFCLSEMNLLPSNVRQLSQF